MAAVPVVVLAADETHADVELGSAEKCGCEGSRLSADVSDIDPLVKKCEFVRLSNPEHQCHSEKSSGSETQLVDPVQLDANELIVGRSVKTRVLHKINGGAFGVIHLGELLSTGEQVAVKLEMQNAPHPQLMSEGNVYRHLTDGPGIPKVHWFGLHEPLYNVMVMDMLGPSLQDLFAYCGRQFSVKTTLMLADQMLEIMEFIHNHQYVHRDIKPDNFLMGAGDKANRVFIVDFGLAKKMTIQRFSVGHIGRHLVHAMVGTVRYASIHAHMGLDEGFRDDLESLAYCWTYFLRGRLPWQGIAARTKEEKFARIHEMKKTITSSALCEGLPAEFAQYLDYVKHLRKEDRPDYKRVRQLFRSLAAVRGFEYDFEFDWVSKLRETGEAVLTRVTTGHSHTSS
jgi:serine/threonine protein kinase